MMTFFHILALIAVLGIGARAVFKAKDLPQRIPIQFDMQLKAKHYGSKWWVLMPPILGLIIWCSMSFLHLSHTDEPANMAPAFQTALLFEEYLLLGTMAMLVELMCSPDSPGVKRGFVAVLVASILCSYTLPFVA